MRHWPEHACSGFALGETSGGRPLANEAGDPLKTNSLGYLQGRAETGLGDRLVALWPVTQTYSYTLYYTSVSPGPTGLSMAEVIGPGVQRLVVSDGQAAAALQSGCLARNGTR